MNVLTGKKYKSLLIFFLLGIIISHHHVSFGGKEHVPRFPPRSNRSVEYEWFLPSRSLLVAMIVIPV